MSSSGLGWSHLWFRCCMPSTLGSQSLRCSSLSTRCPSIIDTRLSQRAKSVTEKQAQSNFIFLDVRNWQEKETLGDGQWPPTDCGFGTWTSSSPIPCFHKGREWSGVAWAPGEGAWGGPRITSYCFTVLFFMNTSSRRVPGNADHWANGSWAQGSMARSFAPLKEKPP